MPTVEEIAAAISGCGTLDEAVTACQQHGWTAVVDDGPLWPRITVTDEDDTNSETFADLLNGMLSPAGPILRRWYCYQVDGVVRVQVPATND